MMPPRMPRVLVVDDTEANRYATAHMLRHAGFEVSEAATGRDALAQLRTDSDVVVLDVNLPDMTGFEVVAHARAADRRLQDAALEWQATFDALAEAVFLLDDAVVQRANRAACVLLAQEDHDIILSNALKFTLPAGPAVQARAGRHRARSRDQSRARARDVR